MAVVYDQREAPVALFDLHRRRSEVPDPQFSRLREALLAQSRRGMGTPPAVLWPLSVIFAGLMVWRLVAGFPLTALALAGLAIGTAIQAWTYQYSLPRATTEQVRDALLDCGLCASCAYDLWDLEEDRSGLRVCPECGAAWSLRPGAVPPAPPTHAYRFGRWVRRVTRRGGT